MHANSVPLNKIPLGKKARVTALPAEPDSRRRILNLGLIHGTQIEPLFQSPFGSPIAYLIHGAVIALRTDLSSKIMVSECS